MIMSVLYYFKQMRIVLYICYRSWVIFRMRCDERLLPPCRYCLRSNIKPSGIRKGRITLVSHFGACQIPAAASYPCQEYSPVQPGKCDRGRIQSWANLLRQCCSASGIDLVCTSPALSLLHGLSQQLFKADLIPEGLHASIQPVFIYPCCPIRSVFSGIPPQAGAAFRNRLDVRA